MTIRALWIPLSNDKWAIFQADFPMTEDNWNLFMTILVAMKPGLVTPTQEAKNDAAE